MHTDLTHEQLVAFINFILEYQELQVEKHDNPTFLMFQAQKVLNMPFNVFFNTVAMLAHIGILELVRNQENTRTLAINLQHKNVWRQFITG